MDSCNVLVFLYKGSKKFEIPICENLNGEDVCKSVAKHLKFRPASVNLFSIRLKQTQGLGVWLWLPSSFKFEPERSYNVEFRMRCKIPTLTELSRLDENAFDYVFHQVRYDMLQGDIPDISQDQTKSEALGLCVTDMLRSIHEDDKTLEYVQHNYRQYIPKAIYKQHKFFLKKRIFESLARILNSDASKNMKYIKEQYISQIEELAPRYFAEEFYAMTYKQEEYPATIRVDPYHPEQPGVSVAYIGKQNVSSQLHRLKISTNSII
jgi:Janus kinase 2